MGEGVFARGPDRRRLRVGKHGHDLVFGPAFGREPVSRANAYPSCESRFQGLFVSASVLFAGDCPTGVLRVPPAWKAILDRCNITLHRISCLPFIYLLVFASLQSLGVFGSELMGFSMQHSHSGSIEGDANADGNTSISVSTTFFPGANIGSFPTNLIILSSDSVFFYVNSKRLLASSNNSFNSHLPVKRNESDPQAAESDPILNLPESSSVLNIVLHTIHDMSCSHYCPTLQDLTSSISALRVYGISVENALAVGAPLYSTVLSYAPAQPIDIYALAAQYDLYDLGAATSSHLLSFQLPTLTDEMAERIGPKYLKKLFFLHLGRMDAVCLGRL